MTLRCEQCGVLIEKKPTGRPAKYCAACRRSLQEAYKHRHVGGSRKEVSVDKQFSETER